MLPLLLLSCRPPEPDSATPDTAVAVEGEFESAETCAECHPRQYTEWRESMHAYAARSPVFDAMASRHFEESGGEIGTFCTGCHALVGESEGEPSPASVLTQPSEDTMRMQWLPESATKSVPSASTASPFGAWKAALVPWPSACRGAPLPARMLTVPSGEIFASE